MRYIGTKKTLLHFIKENIQSPEKYDTFIDCFSGTGCVSEHFKPIFNIISCDLLHCSFVITYCKVFLNEIPSFSHFGGIETLTYLINELPLKEGFIFNEYGENGNGGRLYFSEINSKKIDSIILFIEDNFKNHFINYNEYMYLKYLLLEATSKVANITGVYGAYLKSLHSNSKKLLKIEILPIVTSNKQHNCLCGETYSSISSLVHNKTILYLDPPYNSRQYGSNYHLINTISIGQNPIIKKVKGNVSISGLPQDLPVSLWCSKNKVFNELEKYLRLNYGLLILSYNNEGIMKKDDIVALFNKYGKTKVIEKPYKKYKSNINDNNNIIIEYLFISEK